MWGNNWTKDGKLTHSAKLAIATLAILLIIIVVCFPALLLAPFAIALAIAVFRIPLAIVGGIARTIEGRK